MGAPHTFCVGVASYSTLRALKKYSNLACSISKLSSELFAHSTWSLSHEKTSKECFDFSCAWRVTFERSFQTLFKYSSVQYEVHFVLIVT